MSKVLIGLGSNIEDRSAYLESAINELKSSLINIIESEIYETAPWGKVNQSAFLNMCLAAETTLAPLELLREIKAVEEKIGRKSRELWGPREIDIDILAYDNLVLNTNELKIPHPYLAKRQFVLLPLCDVAANWYHPLLKLTTQELSNKLSEDDVKLFHRP